MRGARSRLGTVLGAAAIAACLGAALAASVAAGAAQAGEPAAEDSGGNMVACAPTRADVSSVALDNLRYGASQAYLWVRARVRVMLKDSSIEEYALSGRADPIAKQMAPNAATAGFTYPGFSCTVRYPGITAVDNCHGRDSQRSCDIGVQFLGAPLAYTFSLSAQRIKLREAAALP